MKDLFWYPASKSALDDFPSEAKQYFGYQLHLLQSGETPDDFKPLKDLGKGISGVYELRYRDENNIFRVAYVARFDMPSWSYTVGRKKTQKTAHRDLTLIANRFREVRDELT